MRTITNFLLDFIKLPFSFKQYTVLAQKTKGYVIVFFLCIVGLTLWAQKDRAIPYVSDVIKKVDSIEIKDGALLLNGGKPYNMQIGNSPYFFFYEPDLDFPPQFSDFTDKKALIIATKEYVYMPRGNSGVQKQNITGSMTLPQMSGAEVSAKYPAFFTGLDIAVFVASAVSVFIMIFFWVVTSFFTGYMLQSFMLRKLPRYTLIKLAVFVQCPVFFVILIARIFNFEIPLFNLAQLCISGLYIQQILNFYPKLKLGDINAAKS